MICLNYEHTLNAHLARIGNGDWSSQAIKIIVHALYDGIAYLKAITVRSGEVRTKADLAATIADSDRAIARTLDTYNIRVSRNQKFWMRFVVPINS